MIEKLQIDALMEGPLGRWLAEQEAVRENAKQQTSRRRMTALLFAVTILPLVFILLPIATQPKLMIAAFGGIMAYRWTEAPKRAAIKVVKIGINDAIATALGIAYRHDCEPGSEFALIKACKMIPYHNHATFEDLWTGQLDGRQFAVYEAKLEKRERSGKRTRWVTVFRGAILSIGIDRRFHCTTLLVRDGLHSGFFGGSKDAINVDGTRLEHVEMVHPDFEDAFDVYSDDPVEARYLIHPLYVERLIALEHSFSGDKAATVFHGGNLVVTVASGNMFESGSIEAADDRAMIARTIDQFAHLVELADSISDQEKKFDG